MSIMLIFRSAVLAAKGEILIHLPSQHHLCIRLKCFF